MPEAGCRAAKLPEGGVRSCFLGGVSCVLLLPRWACCSLFHCWGGEGVGVRDCFPKGFWCALFLPSEFGVHYCFPGGIGVRYSFPEGFRVRYCFPGHLVLMIASPMGLVCVIASRWGGVHCALFLPWWLQCALLPTSSLRCPPWKCQESGFVTTRKSCEPPPACRYKATSNSVWH